MVATRRCRWYAILWRRAAPDRDQRQRHHRSHPARPVGCANSMIARSRVQFRPGFPSGGLAMTMRTRIGGVLVLLVAVCLGLLWWFVPSTGGQVAAAKLAYAKHRAEHTFSTDPVTNEVIHVFKMPAEAHDAGLEGLPNLPFA